MLNTEQALTIRKQTNEKTEVEQNKGTWRHASTWNNFHDDGSYPFFIPNPFQLHPEIRICQDDSANLTRETDVFKLGRFWTPLLSGLQSSTRLQGAVKYSTHVDEISYFQHILSFRYLSSTHFQALI